MSSIAFDVRPWGEDPAVKVVVPVVDGVDLATRIHSFEKGARMEARDESYDGLIPAFFKFGLAAEHYLGRRAATEARRIPLLGCECGEWGCWPLMAEVVANEREVVWTNFEQPHRPKRDYSRFGPFCFSRADYERALADLAPVWDEAVAR